MSDCILRLSASPSPVFLLNSCLDLFSAPRLREDPFSRSYRVILPNSLTVNHPSASVYSTRPRVSVYGTGAAALLHSGFSRESGYRLSRLGPKSAAYSRASAPGVGLPAPVNAFALQPPVPSGGGRATPPSPRRALRQQRNINRSAIGLAIRLILRTRLTPGRLASPGKPWSCGGGASHPPYRYLYLHLLFQTLQRPSRDAFGADWNAPLPILLYSTASAACFIPDYYPRPAP